MSHEHNDIEHALLAEVFDPEQSTEIESAFDMNTIGHMLSSILVQVTALTEFKEQCETEIEGFRDAIQDGGLLSIFKMLK